MKRASMFTAAILSATMLAGTAVFAASHAKPDGMTPGKMMTKDMKADKDGMVTKDEYMKKMGAMWDHMDKEKKGMVKMSDLERVFNTGMAPG